MGAQDVEGHAADDGEVLGRIIFAGSGVVLKEDDVERPMQGVFDGPMGSLVLEQRWREALGEGDGMDVRPGFVVARRRLVSMRPKAARPGKAGASEGARSHLPDAAPPVVSAFDRFVERPFALFVGRREALSAQAKSGPWFPLSPKA